MQNRIYITANYTVFIEQVTYAFMNVRLLCSCRPTILSNVCIV